MLEDYVEFTRSMAIYSPQPGEARVYCALGLAGEVGEVVDKIQKVIRRRGFAGAAKVTYEELEGIALEMGDAFYYFVRLADELGLTVEQIVEMNTLKLKDRRARGVVDGAGDNR